MVLLVPKVLCMVGSSGEELVGTSLPLGTGCHCHPASHGEGTSPNHSAAALPDDV